MVGQCVQEALYIYCNSGYLWAEVEMVFEKRGFTFHFLYSSVIYIFKQAHIAFPITKEDEYF